MSVSVSVSISTKKCVRLFSKTECFNVKDAEIDEDSDVVLEPAKSIPVHDKCQVLVVGGGPSGDITVLLLTESQAQLVSSGLSAALAARRAGADVILMERL